MSAVYHATDIGSAVQTHFAAVVAYFTGNPGNSLEQAAAALSLPYAVCFQIAAEARLVILPSSSGELHWHAHHP